MGVSLRWSNEELHRSLIDSFPILVRNGHYYFPILFVLALFYTISNYFFAALHDPGVVPRPSAEETLQIEKENNITTDL